MFPGSGYAIPEHAIHSTNEGSNETLQGGIFGWAAAVLCGMAFGLVHCATWNFYFPTPGERTMWRLLP
jgi:hypothetical protein